MIYSAGMGKFERLNELAELPGEWHEFVFNELMSEEEREEFIEGIRDFFAQTMQIVEQCTPILMQLWREVADQLLQAAGKMVEQFG